jgi:hypothetical protein
MNGDSGPVGLLAMALVGLPPMLILLTALAPQYVERARALMRGRAWHSLLMGLVNTLFFGVLSLLAGAEFAPLAIVGAIALLVMLPLFLLVGLLVAAGFVGERVWLQVASRPGSLLGSLVLGTAVLGLAMLVPLFGWVLFFALIMTGLGAGILALFQGSRPLRAASPAPAEQVERQELPGGDE